MERQHKLSCLFDGETEKLLDSIGFIIDTDGENELDNDLTVDAFEAAFPDDEEDEKGIEKAINMLYSVLVCATSSGSPDRLGNLLSPSTSIASNLPQIQKRKRKAPAEYDIGHAEESATAELVGYVWATDPKSPLFKKMLWRKKNLLINKFTICFTELDL